MSNTFTVDATNVMSDYELTPAGVYTAIIDEAEYKLNSNGSGKNFQYYLQIVEGNFKGNRIFNNLSIENQSAKTVEIATKEMNSLMLALQLGGLDWGNLEPLKNKPITIKVSVYTNPKLKEGDSYYMTNKIKEYSPYVASQTVAPIQQAPTPVSVGSEAVAKQPWDR